MGATLVSRMFAISDRKEVASRFSKLCEEARREDGEGAYNGSIAQTGGKIGAWKDLRLKPEELVEDEELLESRIGLEKWGPAIAVSYLILKARTEIEKAKAGTLRDRAAEAGKAVEEAKKAAADNARKRPFARCRSCASRIATEFLRGSVKCPVCAKELALTTAGAARKIERLVEKRTAAEARVVAASRPAPSTEVGWIVVAFVGS